MGQIRARGIEALRANITTIAPLCGGSRCRAVRLERLEFADRTRRSLEAMVPRGISLHRRRRARDVSGMSPVGGVGINLAIQDAVAAANLLSEALRTKQRTRSSRRRSAARSAVAGPEKRSIH